MYAAKHPAVTPIRTAPPHFLATDIHASNIPRHPIPGALGVGGFGISGGGRTGFDGGFLGGGGGLLGSNGGGGSIGVKPLGSLFPIGFPPT